jgi:hypothetical protein
MIPASWRERERGSCAGAWPLPLAFDIAPLSGWDVLIIPGGCCHHNLAKSLALIDLVMTIAFQHDELSRFAGARVQSLVSAGGTGAAVPDAAASLAKAPEGVALSDSPLEEAGFEPSVP